MKRFIQLVCLVLVLSMVLALPTYAAEDNARASMFFGSHSCYLWKVSSTQFQVWFDVAAVKGMDVLGVSEIRVQRSSDGVNWEDVQTYYMSDYSQMTCEDTGAHSGCVNYYDAETGYYYRAYVVFYAKLGNGTAIYDDYTSSITMP